MGEEAKEHELGTIVSANKETASPAEANTVVDIPPSNASQNRGLGWRVQIAVFILSVLVGQASAVLLGRLYYNKGGKSKWMSTLVQVVGFPVLLPLYKLFGQKKSLNYASPPPPTPRMSPFKIASVYAFFGLLLAGLCLLYSIGLKYMAVSTFSLICASQLAFNALFAFFLNSQKFTPFIINSVVLLTISSTLLCFHSDSSLPKGVSRRQNIIGFICTITCSAGYALQLSLTQYAFQRLPKKNSFEATLDMIVYPFFFASCATVVGLFASGEWRTLSTEMHHYELGKTSYVMTLLWTALTWQLYSLGAKMVLRNFQLWQNFAKEASILPIALFKLFCGTYLTRNYICDVAYTPGASMLPTINISGDVVLVDRVSPRFGEIVPGDIVIVRSPENPRKIVTKRLIAVENESVTFLVDPKNSEQSKTVVVPKGHLWVQGDNIYDSRDSRDFGPVPYGLLYGKVFWRVWPIKDFGRL